MTVSFEKGEAYIIDITIEEGDWQIQDWEAFFQNILSVVMRELAYPGSYILSVLLTDNESIQSLNAQYRKKNTPTNVLSFPNMEWEKERFLGDVAFAYTVIENEAQKAGKPFLHHMTHLTIHGILHLLGYDHETDKDAEEMEALEISLLRHFHIADPYQ